LFDLSSNTTVNTIQKSSVPKKQQGMEVHMGLDYQHTGLREMA